MTASIASTLASSALPQIGPAYGIGGELPPVVVIVFDELPLTSLLDERFGIDRGLFPNFARLQRDSLWFRNATTSRAFTWDAVPSLLTGMRNAKPDSPNLFSLLDGEYGLSITESLTSVCPGSLCESTSSMDPKAGWKRGLGGFVGVDRGRTFGRFMAQLRAHPEPHFYYLHFAMPHFPWRYLPSGQQYHATSGLPGQIDRPGPGRDWVADDWLVAQAYQRHLMQLAFTDRILGRVIDRLRETDLYGRSLVVVTADHGMAFTSGESKRVATGETVEEIARVPLFLKLPNRTIGRIDDQPAELVDVTPTVMDLLDLHAPSRFDGASLLRDAPDPAARSMAGVDVGDGIHHARSIVARKRQLFAFRKGSIDLYSLAPPGYEGLMGASASALAGPDASGQVTILRRRAIRDASEDDDPLPALVKGIFPEGYSGQGMVAVAIDDRIWAVTRTYEAEGSIRFECMVPPRAFGTPPNQVEAFLVIGGPRPLSLLNQVS